MIESSWYISYLQFWSLEYKVDKISGLSVSAFDIPFLCSIWSYTMEIMFSNNIIHGHTTVTVILHFLFKIFDLLVSNTVIWKSLRVTFSQWNFTVTHFYLYEFNIIWIQKWYSWEIQAIHMTLCISVWCLL